MKNKPIVQGKSDVHRHHKMQSIELIISHWKIWFSAERTKLYLAEALNDWIVYEKELQLKKGQKLKEGPKESEYFDLNGYLITDYSVFLIATAPEEYFYQLLAVFYEIVIKSIAHHRHALKSNNADDIESINSKLMYHKPFEKRDFFNDDLVKLMLGRKIKSSYYDLERAHLISNIKHYPYCSAIDYSGARGPVMITLLKDKNVTINHVKF